MRGRPRRAGPASNTRTRSAFSAVDSRCAIVTLERPSQQPVEGAGGAQLGLRVDRAGGLVEHDAGRGRPAPSARARRAAARPPTATRRAGRPGCRGRAAGWRTSRRARARSTTVDAGRSSVASCAIRRAGSRAASRRTGSPPAAPSARGGAGRRTRPCAMSGSPPRTDRGPPAGSISRVSSLANVVLPEPGLADDGDALTRRQHRDVDVRRAPWGRPGRRTSRASNRAPSDRRSGSATRRRRRGRRRRPGCRAGRCTRRHDAIAFCASVSHLGRGLHRARRRARRGTRRR